MNLISDLIYSLLLHLWISFFLLSYNLFAQNPQIDRERDAFLQEEISPTQKLVKTLYLSESFRLYSTDSVLKYAEISRDLAEQQKDTAALAAAYRHLGWSRGLMQQNIAQLLEDAQKALELAEAVGDSVEIVKVGLDLSRGFLSLRKTEEAEAFTDLAIAYADRHSRGDIRFDAYTAKAYLAILSDLSLSLDFRKKALVQAKINEDTVGMAITYSQIAYLLKFQKSDSVAFFLQAARALFQQKKAPVYEGILMYNLAEYYGDLGYSDSLLVYGLKADELAQQTNYVQISRVVKGLLFAYYFNRQEFASAAPFAREALAIERQRPSVNFISAYVDVARVEAALGRADSAEAYFQAAILALDRLKSPRMEIFVRSYYGEFLKNQGRTREAFQELTTAKILSDKNKEAALQDFLLLQLAETSFDERRFREAKGYYTDAIALGNTDNEADLLSLGYQGLARADSALGDFASAYKNQQLYLKWNDSLKIRTYNEQIAENQTRFETVEKEARIKSLEQQKEIQGLRLTQTRTERNYLIGLAAVLAIGALVVGILLVRLRKRNEEILAQREKLSQLNESKDRLFAMIAHDLRGPVTGFQSTGKIIDYYLKRGENEKLATIGQRIVRQSDQLRQQLDNLLNWSLQQLGLYEAREEKVDLKRLGSEILDRFEEQAKAKSNQLNLDVAPGLSWLGDKNGLSVVLYNLVGNAIKFTENGEISLTAQQTSSELILTVSDTGTGMTPTQVATFSQKSSLDSSLGTAGEKGTGLGLQIVQQLLDYWQGRMEVESAPGKGTNIRICLPLRSSIA